MLSSTIPAENEKKSPDHTPDKKSCTQTRAVCCARGTATAPPEQRLQHGRRAGLLLSTSVRRPAQGKVGKSHRNKHTGPSPKACPQEARVRSVRAAARSFPAAAWFDNAAQPATDTTQKLLIGAQIRGRLLTTAAMELCHQISGSSRVPACAEEEQHTKDH